MWGARCGLLITCAATLWANTCCRHKSAILDHKTAVCHAFGLWQRLAKFLHSVHMLEISPKQKPTQKPQPLLYNKAKQQEEQLKYSLASNLVL